MAITKLGHMKESSRGNPGKHLENAIKYILNPDKTEQLLLTGGNSGYDAAEIFQTFMETKKEFGKLYGRQGYHFIISFKPGEVTVEQVYRLTKCWCEEYLGDGYDHVFAIHNDHEHLHGHVVFNSVSRLDGYKYRYEKGDWEKHIQPVTDRLCEEMGLPKLVFEPESKKKKQYAQWKAEKNRMPTEKEILQADIDAAIAKAVDIKDFYRLMQLFGYEIRQGYSEKRKEKYLSFRSLEKKHARRSYCLDEGYHLADIVKRIEVKKVKKYCYRRPDRQPYLRKRGTTKKEAEILLKTPVFRRYGESLWFVTGLQFRYVKRCYRARHFQSPYAKRNAALRKDIRRIQQLSETCSYLFSYQFQDIKQVSEHRKQMLKNLKAAKMQGDFREIENLKKDLRVANRIIREVQKKNSADRDESLPLIIPKQEGRKMDEQYRI